VTSLKYLLHKTFKDKQGHIVMVQSPNLPLFGWILLELVSLALRKGHTKTAFQSLATAFLFTWAYLEITRGVNYFRRFLGLVVIVMIILSYFMG
jgi:hypothetical protein